jgi:acyl carrier protein
VADVLPLKEFVRQLSQYWQFGALELEVDTPLAEIGIDSLGKLELIIMLEDFAGHEMPDELWTEPMTLREIYSSYEVYAARDKSEADFFRAPST